MSINKNEPKDLSTVAKALEDALTEIAGEKVGFYLSVLPVEEGGDISFISNCSGSDIMILLESAVSHWNQEYSDTTHVYPVDS